MRLKISEILYKEKPATYHVRADAHPGYEICYVDRGRVHVVAGTTDFSLGQGELCIFMPDEHHSLWADQSSAPNIVTIHVRTDFSELRVLGQRKLTLTTREQELLAELVRERGRDAAYRAEIEESLLALLLLTLLRRVNDSTPDRNRITQQTRNLRKLLVEDAKSFIRAHLGEPLSTESIAAAIHVSPSHLSHTFSRTLGVGPMQYVRAARIARAKDLLRTSPLSVTEIARETGFSTIHQFSRSFKNTTGFTPTAYARSLR